MQLALIKLIHNNLFFFLNNIRVLPWIIYCCDDGIMLLLLLLTLNKQFELDDGVNKCEPGDGYILDLGLSIYCWSSVDKIVN